MSADKTYEYSTQVLLECIYNDFSFNFLSPLPSKILSKFLNMNAFKVIETLIYLVYLIIFFP